MSGEPQQDIDSGTGQVVTPGKPVEHTDIQDGASAGHSAEPEHAEGSDGNQPPPAKDGSPPKAEDIPPVVPPPHVSRDDIYAKSNQKRDAEIDGAIDQMDDEQRLQYDRMVAEAGGGDDPYVAAEAPETQETQANAPAQPGPSVQPGNQQPEKTDNQGIDGEPEMTTIVVYGMKEDIPTAEVEAAGGVANFQKERAANIRLARLTTYEASLRDYDNRLSERAAKLERGEQTPAQDGTGITESSPTDTQGNSADIDALAEQVTEGFYSGDRDEAKTRMASALRAIHSDATRAAQASAQQSAPSVDPEAAATAEAERVARAEANAVFTNEFSDLQNPVLRQAVYNMAQEVARDPVMTGRPLAEITREAGIRVRESIHAAGGQPPVNPPATIPGQPPAVGVPPVPRSQGDLAGRFDMKKRTVVTPINEAHGRAPAPAQEQTFPSNSEFVNQLKKGRGQPTT